MSFSYTIKNNLNLVLVEVEGEMNYMQEVAAFSSVLADNRVKKNVRILVDRTKSPSMANYQNINQFIEMATKYLPRIGRPKIALVVADEVEYGMTRMLDLHHHISDSHDFRVFYELGHAFEWLGINNSEIR